MKSVLQKKKMCWVCGTTYNLHNHQVFYGTSNRKQSEKHGMKVWLCGPHHNLSNEGVHFNKEFDRELKRYAQVQFEIKQGTREDFISPFGKSYL